MSKPMVTRPRAPGHVVWLSNQLMRRWIPCRLECVSKARVNEWKRAWAEEFNKGVSNE